MKDNRELVLSLWKIKSEELASRFDYLIGSIASFNEDLAAQSGEHTLSFGELAMLHCYAQQLVEITADFNKPEDEEDSQTIKRIANTSNKFIQIHKVS